MKNNRIRLTSYISPDLEYLIEEYMNENHISTKSQAIERILIEFKYMKKEIVFLRKIVLGNNSNINELYNTPKIDSKKDINKDRVRDSIDDIFSNMPD